MHVNVQAMKTAVKVGRLLDPVCLYMKHYVLHLGSLCGTWSKDIHLE